MRQAIEAPNRQFAFSITCCEMCIGVMKTRQPPINVGTAYDPIVTPTPPGSGSGLCCACGCAPPYYYDCPGTDQCTETAPAGATSDADCDALDVPGRLDCEFLATCGGTIGVPGAMGGGEFAAGGDLEGHSDILLQPAPAVISR